MESVDQNTGSLGRFNVDTVEVLENSPGSVGEEDRKGDLVALESVEMSRSGHAIL